VAAAIEEASCGRGGGDGRDDLEEGVADRQHGIHESELGDGRVAQGHLDAEDVGEGRDRRLEIARCHDYLAQTHGGMVDPQGPGCHRSVRDIVLPWIRRAVPPDWSCDACGRTTATTSAACTPILG